MECALCGRECPCGCHRSVSSWVWVGVLNAVVVAALFASAWALSR